MTSIWGPLGWLTLHSVATSYPESPSNAERALMDSWLNFFRDTITCSYCRGHFAELLERYRMLFPRMLSSRQEFALFSFRAHNAVNARLMKPVYATVAECMDTLQKATAQRSARDYRLSYLNHITRNWRVYNDITGITALKKIQEMQRIEADYVAARDTRFAVELTEETVVLPGTALVHNGEASQQPRINPRALAAGPVFRLTGGGFRLQK
jgi:hypothetical protein